MTHFGNGYYEYDKGKFEAGLTKEGRDVCFTDSYSETVMLGRDYKESDREIVQEYADNYDFTVEW